MRCSPVTHHLLTAQHQRARATCRPLGMVRAPPPTISKSWGRCAILSTSTEFLPPHSFQNPRWAEGYFVHFHRVLTPHTAPISRPCIGEGRFVNFQRVLPPSSFPISKLAGDGFFCISTLRTHHVRNLGDSYAPPPVSGQHNERRAPPPISARLARWHFSNPVHLPYMGWAKMH